MPNPAQLTRLRSSVRDWNEWRDSNPNEAIDLSNADLRDACLHWANLEGANMKGAVLDRAMLAGANLTNADMTKAQLNRVDLSSAVLSGAILENALLNGVKLAGSDLTHANLDNVCFDDVDAKNVDFRYSTLTRTRFKRSILRSANFARAQFSSTFFIYVDMSQAKGLREVHIEQPSAIDATTLDRSRKLPKGFLKKIGLDSGSFQPLVDIRFFVAGTRMESLRSLKDIFATATTSLRIIDSYAKFGILTLVKLSIPSCQRVTIHILANRIGPPHDVQDLLDSAVAFNAYYGGLLSLVLKTSDRFHDRFIIVDDDVVYHLGASIWDAGNKCWMFSCVNDDAIKTAIIKEWNRAWGAGVQIVPLRREIRK